MLPLHRVLAAVAALSILASPAVAENWSRFRGPNGSGVAASTGLPVEFGPHKNLTWSVEIPFARSSPVFAGDKVFLTAIDGDKFTTLALDRKSGERLWQRETERNRTDEIYKGSDSATPSPATDGSNVYAFFQEVGLVSYTTNGEQRWELSLGPFRNFYGIAASPVLAGDTLLLLCDQSMGSYLLAVDKNTGKELWRQHRPARLEAYSTPILYPDSSNPRQILVSGSMWVDAYDIDTGKSAWTLDGVGTSPVASPVLAGDILFVNAPDHAAEPPPSFAELAKEHDSNDDGRLQKAELEGTWMVNHFGFVDVDGNGSLTTEDWSVITGAMVNDNWGLFAIQVPDQGADPKVLWNYQQSVPYIPSPLVYKGVFYMVDDGIVSSLDPQTGKLHKRGRLVKGSPKVYASPVAADGKIYIATLEGQVAVLAAGPNWEILSINDLGEEIHASPAIVDGHLYIRTRQKLYDFGVREE